MKKNSVICSLCEKPITDLLNCHTIIDDKVGKIMSGKESPSIYLLCPLCYQVFCVEFHDIKLEIKNG